MATLLELADQITDLQGRVDDQEYSERELTDENIDLRAEIANLEGDRDDAMAAQEEAQSEADYLTGRVVELEDEREDIEALHGVLTDIESAITSYHEDARHEGGSAWCQETPCHGVFKAIGSF
jgi:chromosome segregation ATPase